MPKEKSATFEWEWIKKALPSLEDALHVYQVANLLVKPSLCTLANMESPGPEFEKSYKLLRKELDQMVQSIKKRNHSYKYLSPENVPCSIDI